MMGPVIRYVTVALVLTNIIFITGSEGAKWSYSGKTGPEHWNDIFVDQCGGSNQSPIDVLPEETLYSPTLRDFAIWYDPPKPGSQFNVHNNGHALQVDLVGEFFVTNGGLEDLYRAAQFHFHWGSKDGQGSEHTVDGKASPIEMHLVTFKDKYASIGDALQDRDGLAVLGVMFEISEEDNPAFENIVKAIKYIRDPTHSPIIMLPNDTSIRDLLPADISRYYRYQGSLTTPSCSEAVVWTVFDQKQTLSHAQLKEFRTLMFPKRHHRHHHHQEKRSVSGRAREMLTLTEAEREQRRREKHAMAVLEELGIKSTIEEQTYYREVIQKRGDDLMMADAPMDPTAGQNEVHTTVAEGGHHATESNKSEHETPSYTQDALVDNYRPVQPINDRLVYRSFKLRDPPYTLAGGDALVQSQAEIVYAVEGSDPGHGNDIQYRAGTAAATDPCDGAASMWASSLMLLVSVVFSLAYVL